VPNPYVTYLVESAYAHASGMSANAHLELDERSFATAWFALNVRRPAQGHGHGPVDGLDLVGERLQQAQVNG
jgi:hypothetical protein